MTINTESNSHSLFFTGSGDLQVQHTEEGDVRTVRMAEAVARWNAYNRSDARAQAADNQQGRLGQPVSNNKLRTRNSL